MEVAIHFKDEKKSTKYYMDADEISIVPQDDEYPDGKLMVSTNNERNRYKLSEIKQLSSIE